MSVVSADSFEEALGSLGVISTTLSASEKAYLDEQGYLILPGMLEPARTERLRNTFEAMCEAEHRAAGGLQRQDTGTRHLENLLGKSAVVEELCAYPRLLAAVYHVLGRSFRLAGLDGRDPRPGYGQQGLHADGMPLAPGDPFPFVNALWLLDAFTAENGATRIVPGSHRLKRQPGKSQADPNSHHPEEMIVTAPAGSALIFNGHLWHSGTRNRSKGSRRVIRTGFIAKDAVLFTPSTFEKPEKLTPAMRFLLGE